MGIGSGDVWSTIEGVCVWGGVPCFTLEDVEMGWLRLLDAGLKLFPLGMGIAC